MKILVDLRKMSYNPSGIGVYINNFVNSIINKKDIEIIGITDVLIGKEIKELKSRKIKIIEYGKKVDKNFEVFKYFDFIDTAIGTENVDVFWEPNQIITKNLKINNPKVKIIITIHDIFPITEPKYYNLKYRVYFRHFEKKTIHNCDYIVYVSNLSKTQTNYYFKESLGKKDFISYNIVQKDNYNLTCEDKGYFLYIGNLERRKGVHILLSAYKKYLDNHGEKLLKIAGSIREEEIRTQLDEINSIYSGKINYLGYVDDKTKYELMYKCSAFVFPSFAEGFGIPAVEALLCGKKTIVSNIEIFKEILGNNENIEYYDIYDNESKTVNNLVRVFINTDNSKMESVNKYTNEYESVDLGKKFAGFLKKI